MPAELHVIFDVPALSVRLALVGVPKLIGDVPVNVIVLAPKVSVRAIVPAELLMDVAPTVNPAVSNVPLLKVIVPQLSAEVSVRVPV